LNKKVVGEQKLRCELNGLFMDADRGFILAEMSERFGHPRIDRRRKRVEKLSFF